MQLTVLKYFNRLTAHSTISPVIVLFCLTAHNPLHTFQCKLFMTSHFYFTCGCCFPQCFPLCQPCTITKMKTKVLKCVAFPAVNCYSFQLYHLPI